MLTYNFIEFKDRKITDFLCLKKYMSTRMVSSHSSADFYCKTLRYRLPKLIFFLYFDLNREFYIHT